MDLDLNSLRAGVTVLSFLAFCGVVAWALARRNQAAFDEAARLPFAGESASPSEGEPR
ncbi:CcoQ/FixQ family Cbb3-type cytochrome c oxidase assembly chaperone [Piscinibacter sakaiensis]|uniref:Uncharacterized protein n=1 Tax=Piscinibacter sakaiensis TaxID=1547922 RepID=A0A0K8NTW7_PISS1|nr:CcoQ/FixQ family Cbb3-type cytochrome c oxidase assembly chaperone [Piscinibacter sakaiensis]GAP33694.1 hypothetical protein ISF6_0140 [Piscinibacter sakaiensis]